MSEESNVFTGLTAWENLMFTTSLYLVPRRMRDEGAHQRQYKLLEGSMA